MKKNICVATIAIAVCLTLAGCGVATGPDSSVAASAASSAVASDSLYTDFRTLTVPCSRWGHAKVVGEYVYITVDRSTGWIDTLIRLDPRTGEWLTILENDSEICWMAASDTWIVWETDWQLLARRVADGKTVVLDTGQGLYAPAIEGSLVAWFDQKPDTSYQISVCDLESGVTTALADIEYPSYYNSFVDLRDGKVLWTDIIHGQGRYRIEVIATGEMAEYPVANTRYRYPGYADAYGDRFYSINFDNCVEWDWTKQQFGYYSVSSGQFNPIITADPVAYVSACGHAVALINSSQHLLLFDADSPGVVEDLSDELGMLFGQVDVADSHTLVAYPNEVSPDTTSCPLYLIAIP